MSTTGIRDQGSGGRVNNGLGSLGASIPAGELHKRFRSVTFWSALKPWTAVCSDPVLGPVGVSPSAPQPLSPSAPEPSEGRHA